ncbi:DUF1071 domain-containing protein, partial [Staphylococcus aureus]|nr:DUF1071 domain-containing protein [Staphylococcus aureus]MCS5020821.1 DUF1071 domain-containing protein [Staphylococcus aureus]
IAEAHQKLDAGLKQLDSEEKQ